MSGGPEDFDGVAGFATRSDPPTRGIGLKWEREVRRRHLEFAGPDGVPCECLVLYSADNEHWRLIWVDAQLRPRRLERRMRRTERRLARWLRRHDARERTADDLVEARNAWLT